MQSNGNNNHKVSVFQNHYKMVAVMQFDEILSFIRNGEFNSHIQKIRQLKSKGKFEEAQKEKQKLKAFTASGVFERRRKADFLKYYNRLITLDFDKLESASMDEYISKAKSIEYTYCCFISPSGNGLKVFIRVDSEKEHHKTAFDQVAAYYEKEFGVPIDRSGSDITRLCYLSYDSNLYLNTNSKIFHVDIKTSNSDVEVKQPVENVNSYAQYLKAVKYTKNVAKYKDHNRNNFIYTLAKNCNARNINIEDAIAFITKDYGYDEKRDEASIKSGYNQPVKENKVKKTPLFSIDYLRSKRFKPKIKADTRVFFEVLLMKYIRFKKTFYYSRSAIKSDLGINKDRALTIMKYFKKIEFLDFEVRTTQIDGNPRQVTYFTIFPENIPRVIDQLMEDGEEVKELLKHFLDSGESIDIGYGYEE